MTTRPLFAAAMAATIAAGCIPILDPAALPQPSAAPRPVGPNPLAGLRFYVDPGSHAKAQADAWRASRPADAAAMDRLAREPVAAWFGDWSGDVAQSVDEYVSRADSAGAVPLLVAYNIPDRDCGQFSAGGASAPDAYRLWIRYLARGIGSRPAIVVLEPDALGLLTKCLSAEQQQRRLSLLSEAVAVLGEHPKTRIYIDAGNAKWIPAADMAGRLRSAGIGNADGFALNVSNYISTAESVAYGKAVSAALGGKHFIVDTSRNGNGATADLAWCNPPGRAIGEAPTTTTGDPAVDAYLWVKVPGESDGECNGGPRAGAWWPEQALGLAQGAKR